MTPLEINKKIAMAKSPMKFISYGFEPDAYVYYSYIKDNFVFMSKLYNWAENIADAWELFEELPEGTSIMRVYSSGGKYSICLRDDNGALSYDNENIKGFFLYETAPLAICMAWIKWKESK